MDFARVLRGAMHAPFLFEQQTINRKVKAISIASLIFIKPQIEQPIDHSENIGMKARIEIRVNVEDKTNRTTCNTQIYRASFREAQNRQDSLNWICIVYIKRSHTSSKPNHKNNNEINNNYV